MLALATLLSKGRCWDLSHEERVKVLSGSKLPEEDPTLADSSLLPASTPIDYEDNGDDPHLFPDPATYDSLI